MAIEEGLVSTSFKAAKDLSSYQYYFVMQSGSDIDIVDNADYTDAAIGILQNEPESGETAEVAYGGISKVEAGDDLTLGDYIGSLSNGKGTPITGTPSDSDISNARKVMGLCTVAASNGEVGSVMIDKALI